MTDFSHQDSHLVKNVIISFHHYIGPGHYIISNRNVPGGNMRVPANEGIISDRYCLRPSKKRIREKTEVFLDLFKC